MNEMKYIAIYHQEGGCDYTIGCGISVDELKSTSRDDAVEEVKIAFGIGSEDGDRNYDIEEISSVTLLEVSCEVEIDLDLLRNEIEKERKKSVAAAQEAAEKAEFERLYRKYGGQK